MSVEQGMDVERCKDIADELKRLGSQLGDIGGDGSSLMSTLVETWSGPDCERLFVDWTFTGRPQIDRSSGDITRFSEDLRTQAVEQDLASDISGPLEGTSTAKSAWDRAKDGVVNKMRWTAGWYRDHAWMWPPFFPGVNPTVIAAGADSVDSAANWVDDPKKSANDWQKKSAVDKTVDVISILPQGRGARGAKNVLDEAEDAAKKSEGGVDAATHGPDAPDRDADPQGSNGGTPDEGPDRNEASHESRGDDSGKGDDSSRDEDSRGDDDSRKDEPAETQQARQATTEDAGEIANGHAYEKHVVKKGEYPEIDSPQEFEEHITDVAQNGEVKHLSNGRVAYWKDGTVVIHNPKGKDSGTAFRPEDGKEYFEDLE